MFSHLFIECLFLLFPKKGFNYSGFVLNPYLKIVLIWGNHVYVQQNTLFTKFNKTEFTIFNKRQRSLKQQMTAYTKFKT